MIRLLLLLLVLSPGCYVVKSGYYQAELLASRRRVDKVEAKGLLTPEQLAAIAVLDDARAWGAGIGLSATHNYESIALRWKRQIWVVTGCAPLAFEPRTKWFPIVGRVSYLGWFTEKAARRDASRLRARGMDVSVRTAGAYSTLGWFRDPILPGMLTWSERGLADTLLHELAHATLWVPGSVAFNESFASFVGQTAAIRYLRDKHGPDSEAVQTATGRYADERRWDLLQHGLYADLDALYRSEATDAEKLAGKAAILATIHDRIDAAGFADAARYHAYVDREPLDNAALVEHQTYDSRQDDFRAVLDAVDGDLLAFIDEIRRIAKSDKKDPFGALSRAAHPTE